MLESFISFCIFSASTGRVLSTLPIGALCLPYCYAPVKQEERDEKRGKGGRGTAMCDKGKRELLYSIRKRAEGHGCQEIKIRTTEKIQAKVPAIILLQGLDLLFPPLPLLWFSWQEPALVPRPGTSESEFQSCFASDGASVRAARRKVDRGRRPLSCSRVVRCFKAKEKR